MKKLLSILLIVIGFNLSAQTLFYPVRINQTLQLVGIPGTGSGLTIDGSGFVSRSATAGTGTVTSIGISSTDFSVSGSPVTTSGNITLDLNAGVIFNADINASAGIDATKVSTGVVDNTEFNYMNGVTSAVQTQLNNKGYVITLSGSQNTVADATPYYSGAITNNTSTNADINRVYLPFGGTIKACYITFYNSSTLATGESSTFAIRINNTTDVTVSTSVLNNAINTTASNTGLSTVVSQGDYIEGKFTTATWSTNPANIRWTITIFIQ